MGQELELGAGGGYVSVSISSIDRQDRHLYNIILKICVDDSYRLRSIG
jgi:hypothetical protein